MGNQRLAASERQAAVYEERTLLAQQLHDSIPQSLAFLKMQTHLLHDSLTNGKVKQTREELGRIREGIQDSYDDVRELLVHFRVRPEHADLNAAIAGIMERFQAHSGIRAAWVPSGSGIPIEPEIQLQVLHIIQESLSNVRKQAQASEVRVDMTRDPVPSFSVVDNGVGFDPDARRPDSMSGCTSCRSAPAASAASHRHVAPSSRAAFFIREPVGGGFLNQLRRCASNGGECLAR